MMGAIAVRYVLVAFALFFANQGFGQKQYWQWQFSQGMGLDFSTNPPAVVRSNNIGQIDGGASIADEDGNLLFYVGGSKVYNNSFTGMPNGAGLAAGFTSTQGALIVPNPVLKNLFYVFTTDDSGDKGGWQYNVVNMDLDGGRGDVTVKNIKLDSVVAEKQCAVRMIDSCGYWAITHQMDNNTFQVMGVTADGVVTPPDSIRFQSIGLSHTFNNVGVSGQMKFSEDGSMLAVVNRSKIGVELFDFDARTGTISNPRYVSTMEKMYGLAFSKNSEVLYVSERENLFKFDVSGDPTNESLLLTRSIMASISCCQYLQGLQIGPYGNIWVNNQDSDYLGLIENADSYASTTYDHLSFYSTGASIRNSTVDMTVGMDWDDSNCAGVEPTPVDKTLRFYRYVTPNGDALNDEFWIDNIHWYPTSVLTVYNSLGERIFEKTGYDNTWSPTKYDAGTYLYRLVLESGIVHSGRFSLVK